MVPEEREGGCRGAAGAPELGSIAVKAFGGVYLEGTPHRSKILGWGQLAGALLE